MKSEVLKKQVEKDVLDASGFIKTLTKLATMSAGNNAVYFKGNDAENEVFNVRLAAVFAAAKHYKLMPVEQIAILLKSKIYEVRLGPVRLYRRITSYS